MRKYNEDIHVRSKKITNVIILQKRVPSEFKERRIFTNIPSSFLPTKTYTIECQNMTRYKKQDILAIQLYKFLQFCSVYKQIKV